MPLAVILTALEVEYLAVRNHLIDLQEEEHPQGTIYERGKFVTNGQTWEVGIAQVGAGNSGSAIEASWAIAYFKPNILFFVGIAGGIKDVEIGHVVAATDIYNYESGKVGEQFSTRPKSGKSAHKLVQRAIVEARKPDWLKRLSNSPSSPIKVHVAPIVAGEKVVVSRESDVFKLIRASYNDAIAIEMEGYGFLSAAFAYPEIGSIVIRGISDLVEGKNDDSVEPEDNRQAKASAHASAFAFEILSKLQPNSSDISQAPEIQYGQIGQRIPSPRCRKVFGREDLTEIVLDLLKNPKTAPILCLGGVAGYGKTEAAACVAKAAIAQSIVKDVLWVQIRESELTETFITSTQRSDLVQWKEVVYQLSRQLDCPDDRDSVQKSLRSQKWLVVLDNAETSDLNDILPKLVTMLDPSRVLLTSRVNTPFPYVKVIDCPGLSKYWSQQLLLDEAKENEISALLDASETQVQRLYELSCGAPLALHFIVGRVRDDRVLQPVLDALEEANGEVEIFYRFTLETAWQRLSYTSKQLLRYMAQADIGVKEEELQQIFPVSAMEWRESRDRLRRWSLILPSNNPQRYDLHPWVRRSVRSNLSDNWEVQTAPNELDRIAQWYLE